MNRNLLLTLVLAGCDAMPEGDIGSESQALDGTVTLYPMAGYSGTPRTLTGTTDDLADFDNKTVSLKNNTGGIITLWSKANHTGRCQLVFPGMWIPNLAVSEMGPYRLSSVEFGRQCGLQGVDLSELTVYNETTLSLVRFRVDPDNLTGSWSDSVDPGVSSHQTFPKNAWTVRVKTQWNIWGWQQACSDHTWTTDDEIIANQWVVVEDDNTCYYSGS